jgi:hypothetical protein
MASDATAGYAFYLPLSVRVWAEVAGFESIVVLVGAEWREQTQLYTAEVISALDSTGATVVVLDVPPGSYTLSTVAQLSRLLVACGLELQPEDPDGDRRRHVAAQHVALRFGGRRAPQARTARHAHA